MYTPPLLDRAVALHVQELRTEVARDRQAHTAIVSTRTRGGIFLTLRSPRPERELPRPQLNRLRPALT